MSITDMHDEFRLLLDKGGSFDAPAFMDTEIDAFFNISIEKFVSKRMFGNNVRGTAFEQDQKRRDDLRNLVTTAHTGFLAFDDDANKPNGLFVVLPGDYRHSINEECILSGSSVGLSSSVRVGVKPITHDSYNKLVDDPFNKPEALIVYRLDFEGDRFEIIFGEGIIPADKGYVLRYIKNPATVSIDDEIDCDLSSHTHKEIVRMAVLEALENVEQPRYQSTKIELNEIE